MSAPAAVLAAIGQVSGTIPCLQCWSTVEITYDATADQLVVRHPVRHTFGADAIAVGELVLAELGRHVLVGQYNEDLPAHETVT